MPLKSQAMKAVAFLSLPTAIGLPLYSALEHGGSTVTTQTAPFLPHEQGYSRGKDDCPSRGCFMLFLAILWGCVLP